VEDSLGRLQNKGFDIGKVICGMGTCPIAPPVRDEFKGMDRVNTALVYGSIVRYVVDCRDEEIQSIMPGLPFNSSPRFGETFASIFEKGKRDFYIADKDIHTLAVYEITNYATGNTFKSGEIRIDMVKQAFAN